jgi:cysteine desulfurase
MIYLDNASTTIIAPEVIQEMLPYLKDEYGNAGTIHKLGRMAASAIEQARKQAALLFGCSPEHIIFTSGGSESNSLAIKGAINHLSSLNKKHVIIAASEHISVLKSAAYLEKNGFEVTYIQPTGGGHILPKLIERAIRDNTGLVAAMYVNNEVGAVNDILKIGKICDDRRILFHSDCVQAAGCHEIHTAFSTGSISSHKIHGPKGVGALYIKERGQLSPLISGGDNQEFGIRGGTENVAGIVGFGKACEIAFKRIKQDQLMVSTLKQGFVAGITSVFGDLKSAGIHINGHSATEPGKVLNLRVDGVSSETLLLMLDAEGVCVSAGSACHAHEDEPSHVLIAMGLTPQEARSSIRLSFSRYTTKEEVLGAVGIFTSCVSALRQFTNSEVPV